MFNDANQRFYVPHLERFFGTSVVVVAASSLPGSAPPLMAWLIFSACWSRRTFHSGRGSLAGTLEAKSLPEER
jgi:hypothetical protein